MNKVYESHPNIVKVVMTDKSGTTERHIVGYTLDEVVESVTLGLDGAEQAAFAMKTKTHRRKRRTKAQIAAAQTPEGVPPAHEKEKAWA